MDIEGDIIIRDADDDDARLLEEAFAHMNHSIYTSYYRDALLDKSEFVIAIMGGKLLGYAKLDWHDESMQEDIPVIKEIHVKSCYRNQGIGSSMMAELEKRVGQKSDYCAIGVGLSDDYEPAQHLLEKRGYNPDGNGIFYIEPGLIYNELDVDENQALMMVKELRN